MIRCTSMTCFEDWTCSGCGTKVSANESHGIPECNRPYPVIEQRAPRIPSPDEPVCKDYLPTADEPLKVGVCGSCSENPCVCEPVQPDSRVLVERAEIVAFLNRMAESMKWRLLADTDEIRHFVGHAEDYISAGLCATSYLGDDPSEAPPDSPQTAQIQNIDAERELNKLRLEDCLELGGIVTQALISLNEIATFVPENPQSYAETLEQVTDLADKAHVAIERQVDTFNNKPDLASRAIDLRKAHIPTTAQPQPEALAGGDPIKCPAPNCESSPTVSEKGFYQGMTFCLCREFGKGPYAKVSKLGGDELTGTADDALSPAFGEAARQYIGTFDFLKAQKDAIVAHNQSELVRELVAALSAVIEVYDVSQGDAPAKVTIERYRKLVAKANQYLKEGL